MKAIPGAFQHTLVVADNYKNGLRKAARKIYIERQMIIMLTDDKISKQSEEKVIELVNISGLNL